MELAEWRSGKWRTVTVFRNTGIPVFRYSGKAGSAGNYEVGFWQNWHSCPWRTLPVFRYSGKAGSAGNYDPFSQDRHSCRGGLSRYSGKAGSAGNHEVGFWQDGRSCKWRTLPVSRYSGKAGATGNYDPFSQDRHSCPWRTLPVSRYSGIPVFRYPGKAGIPVFRYPGIPARPALPAITKWHSCQW